MFQCTRCGSKKTNYFQKQTRSADEVCENGIIDGVVCDLTLNSIQLIYMPLPPLF